MKVYPWTNVGKVLKKSLEEAKDSELIEVKDVREYMNKYLQDNPYTKFELLKIKFDYWFYDVVWKVYRFFKPAHQRIRKSIPKQWTDLTELTLIINFEIIKSFVEEEMDEVNWEAIETDKAAGDWLRTAYHYITVERDKLQKELDQAYFDAPYNKKLSFEETYKEVHKIEKTIRESDKSILIGLANYREYLWT